MKSTLSTVVAVVRHETGLSAQEFAELIGKSYPTLKSLESGRLKLSERTALDISRATGVSLEWLLAGDPKTLPTTHQETVWTREQFSWHEAEKIKERMHKRIRKHGGGAKESAVLARRVLAGDVSSSLLKVLEGVTKNEDQFALALAKARRFVFDLERDLKK
jgi:transcriptional regulator with XRE-family HTH domain